MKILCLCERGNSRSVALAWMLKDHFGMDALACGILSNGDELKNFLYKWADKIILVDQRFIDMIPQEYKDKLKVWDVGPDRFFRGFEPELLQAYEAYLRNDPL